MSGNTLPLSIRHLDPCIGPTLIHIERLTRRVGALQFLEAGRDGRVPKNSDLYIAVVGTAVFARFSAYQHLSFPAHFAITRSGHKLVGNCGSDQVQDCSSFATATIVLLVRRLSSLF